MRVALLAILASACAQDPAPYAPLEGSAPRGTLVGSADTNIFGDEVPSDAEDLWAFDPELDGNVGDVDVYGGGRIHDAYWLSDYAYVELRDTGTTGAMMVALSIIGVDQIEPGTYRFSREGREVPAGTSDLVEISAIGCSGASEDMWTFDRPGEQLDVQVTEGANADELRFEVTAQLASYLDERSTITAGFTVVRTSEAPAP